MKEKNKVGNLETYGEPSEEDEPKKENILKRVWNKTIFPEKIREKREAREYEDELRRIAKEEAKEEIKKTLIKQYKQEEIDKATKKKSSKNWGKKLAEGFSMSGDGAQDNKFARALGASGSGIVNDEKINSMVSSGSYGNEFEQNKPKKKTTKKKTTKKKTITKTDDYNFEDRIKRML